MQPVRDPVPTAHLPLRPLAAAGREPVQADPSDERVASLEEENARLRAELEAARKQGPNVSFRVGDNRIELRDLKVAGVSIDRLKLKLDKHTDLLKGVTLETFLASPGKMLLPSMDPLTSSAITVEDLRVTVPSATANEAVRLRGAEVLQEEGISDLNLRYLPGGGIEAEGLVHRVIGVPFRVRGHMELTEDQKIRFTPEKVRVFGVVPVPRLVTSIAAALAGDSLEKLDIRSEGDSLIIDPKAFIPQNLKLRLTRLTTEGDRLILEGGPPPQPDRNPRTLRME
ncbi:MAG: hypothetical protein AB1758_31130 [Candidatus Eremiobacterota bacterium]